MTNADGQAVRDELEALIIKLDNNTPDRPPEQAIHDKVWGIVKGVTPSVYEPRPMTEVKYPFTDFQSVTADYIGAKTGAPQRVTLVLNVWDTEKNRLFVSRAGAYIIEKASRLTDAYGHGVTFTPGASESSITLDTTVTPPVWRNMVTLVFLI